MSGHAGTPVSVIFLRCASTVHRGTFVRRDRVSSYKSDVRSGQVGNCVCVNIGGTHNTVQGGKTVRKP